MVCPIEDRHASEPPTGQRHSDRLREDPAIDDAWNRDGREVPHQIVGRQLAQALCSLIGAAGAGRESLAVGLSAGEGPLRQREGSALHDCPPEQPAGTAGHEVREYCGAAGRLARNGDVVRVATELFDVEPYPAQAACWSISP